MSEPIEDKDGQSAAFSTMPMTFEGTGISIETIVPIKIVKLNRKLVFTVLQRINKND